MNTLTMESLLLLPVDDAAYDFDLCVTMLQAAMSANCVGQAPAFWTLVQLMVELQTRHVLSDVSFKEAWTRTQCDEGEIAYHTYVSKAAAKLAELVVDYTHLDQREIRHHTNEIHRFLGGLSGLAYQKIKRVVATNTTTSQHSQTPRPNDIA